MQRRTYLGLCCSSVVAVAGCTETDTESVDDVPLETGEARPPGSTFVRDGIEYTVDGTTATSLYVGSTRYYAKDGGMLLRVRVSQENVSDTTRDIDHGGTLANADGETEERKKGLYGTTDQELQPGDEVDGLLLYALPIGDDDWFFVIGGESVHVPTKPEVGARLTVDHTDRSATLEVDSIAIPFPGTGTVAATYEDIDSGSLELATPTADSTRPFDVGNSELQWRPGETLQVVWTHDRYESTTEVIAGRRIEETGDE